MNDATKIELNKVELYFDRGDNDYFLRLEYICEDEAERYKLIYPKVLLSIPKNVIPVKDYPLSMRPKRFIINQMPDFEGLPILPVEGVFCYRHSIKKKIHKLTVEEIEKKLGYRVEIISKDET